MTDASSTSPDVLGHDLTSTTPTAIPATTGPAEPAPTLVAESARSAGIDSRDRIALGQKQIEIARKLGDADVERRILASLEADGIRPASPGPDKRSPAEREWDADHEAVGLLPTSEASAYDLGPALRSLPASMPPEQREAISKGMGEALRLMGLPARLGSSLAEMGLREGLRVSSLSEAEQLAHAEKVRQQIAATGRDFSAVQKQVQGAMQAVQNADPKLYDMLLQTNWLADATVFTMLADAWERSQERAKLAKGRRK